MDMSTVIKNLSVLVFDNSLVQPRSIKDLQTELRSADTQLGAMKTIVSMLQQSYDMGILYSDVLRIIDTSNPELKILCNVYLKSTCADRPACQLMCTHTFLKDFNDRNWVIQRLAVNDAVQLADEIIIKNYTNDIKRMCAHVKREVRMAAARCISLFYQKNRSMFFHENLIKYLKGLLSDGEDDVVIAAAKSISSIESKENIVSMKDVCKIAGNFIEKRNCQGIRAALEIGKYKRLTDQARHMLMKLLHSGDICIFYLSSMKLLENDKSLYQLVYNTATGFMTSRAEQLYNLLVYIDSFLDKVDSNSRDFLVLDSDPDYIKDMKIRLLVRKYDDFAEREVKRLIRRGERVLRILECALEFDVVISGIFECLVPDQYDQSLRAIHEYLLSERTKAQENTKGMQPIEQGGAWSAAIGEYLSSIKCGIGEARTYIELCGRFCRSIPFLIFKLENELNSAYILNFYCLMMNRGIISEHQCLNYLKNLRKIVPYMPRIKLVMKHINVVDAEDIYGDVSMEYKRSECKVDFPIVKDYEDGILRDRPFQNYSCSKESGWREGVNEAYCASHEDLRIYTNRKKSRDKHSKSMQNISHASRKDASASGSKITAKSMPVYIDAGMFKGTLDIVDSKMVLTADILEESQSVRYSLHTESGRQLQSDTGGEDQKDGHGSDVLECCSEISNEGRYTLFAIEDAHLGSTFRFEIGDTIFEVEIDIYKMIRPLQCDLETFESCFSQAEGAMDLDTLNTDNCFEVCDSCYAFEVFGQNVFAKRFGNLVTLKGRPEILEKFK